MATQDEPAKEAQQDGSTQVLDQDLAHTTVESGYLPVDSVLLAPGPTRAFDLYQRVDGAMVLICAKDYPLSAKVLAELRENRQDTLFVLVAEGPLVSWQAEGMLREVVLDEGLTVDRRSRILVSSARTIMSEIMAHPSAKGVIRRGMALANTTVNFMAQEPAALRSLATLFTKDYCTYAHCVRTCVLGVALYKYVVSPKIEYLRRFGLGMLLHDTGKSLVEHYVLNKPERLTHDEFDHIKSHSALGWQILQSHGVKDNMVNSIARHHHEKLDGSGYPDGLAGSHITDEARVAAIVDVYDALTSERPYRTAMAHEQAQAMMGGRMVGNHLDPELFSAFIRIGEQIGNLQAEAIATEEPEADAAEETEAATTPAEAE